jgi:S-layer protein (TIGR01567 family)
MLPFFGRRRSMKTKKYLGWGIVIFNLFSLLLSSCSAQEPVETSLVRGHISSGDGIWRADDFGWFYYDLDEGQGNEALYVDVDVDERRAEKGHIVYNATIWHDQFQYDPWGSYKSISFLGKHYLAGYPTSFLTDEVSSLGKGELRQVLIDTDEQHTLVNNISLPLIQDYSLLLNEISTSNEEVNLVLLKNGKPVDFAVVSEGETYTYRLGDIPIILVHVSNIMRDAKGKGFAEIDGIFQISDIPDVRMREGAKLGIMEVIDISSEGFEMRNSGEIAFSRDNIVTLGGGLELVILDNPELIYYLQGRILDYGIHVIRGPTFTGNSRIPVRFGDYPSSVNARWDSTNFSGFFFDPETSIGYESLVLSGIDERSVPLSSPILIENDTAVANGLQYTSLIQSKDFDFKPWGQYGVATFLGQQWFAGYGNNTQFAKKLDPKKINFREYDQLGKVLIDTEVRGNMVSGNYTLAEGYELFLRDVVKDKIFINLKKDGQIVDSAVLIPNSTYIYRRDVGEAKEVPIIALHIDNIFANETMRFAEIDGIFQLSERYVLPIEPGVGIGKVEIVSTPPEFIGMRNNKEINLNANSDINIWPGANIRVANNNTLRYYVYTLQYVVPSPELAREIDYPKTVFSTFPANFSMIAKAWDIISVSAEIADSTGKTVFFKDLTNQAKGSGDLSSYFWTWNASVLKLNDDGSQIMDAGPIRIPALLYVDEYSPPKQVGVKFNESGWIASIASNEDHYYVSPSEYNSTKSNITYEEMLSNEAIRSKYIKVELGRSRLKFVDWDILNGTMKLGPTNHTISGSFAAIEPYAERFPAPQGKYELKVRIENPINALRISGMIFDVNPSELHEISIGSNVARANKPFQVRINVSQPVEKGVSISFDTELLRFTGVSGPCQTDHSLDQKAGRITIAFPANCNSTNLTFVANKANVSTKLEVVDVEGIHSDRFVNGSIIVVPDDNLETRKSDGFTFLSALISILLLIFVMFRSQ